MQLNRPSRAVSLFPLLAGDKADDLGRRLQHGRPRGWVSRNSEGAHGRGSRTELLLLKE